MPITAEEARNRAKKIAPEVIHSETWDCDFLMRGLSLIDGMTFFRDYDLQPNQPFPPEAIAPLVVRCVVDNNRERIWTDADATDLQIDQPDLIVELFPHAKRLSGLGAQQIDAEKKTSSDTPGSSSATSSAATSESSTPTPPLPGSQASS